MKKAYEAPALEVETFELNSAIAASCGTKVDFGPIPEYNPESSACDSFGDPFDSMNSAVETSFYDDTGATCSCYYSSSGDNYVTS